MTDHVSRCPNCETSFIVSAAQLEAADGAVRCGACLQVFNATDYFVTAPIADLFADEANHPAESHDPETGFDGDSLELENSPEQANSSELLKSPEPISGSASAEDPGSGDNQIQVAYWHPNKDLEQSNDPEYEERRQDQGEAATAWESHDNALDFDEADSPEPENSPEQTNSPPQTYRPEPIENAEEINNPEPQDSVTGTDSADSFASGSEQAAEIATDDESPENLPTDSGQGEHGPDVSVVGEPEVAALDPELQEKISEGLPDLEAGTVADLEAEQTLANRSSGLRWFVAVLSLVMVGAVQFAWFERSTYALQPDYRGYYEAACNALNCSLPEYSDVSRLRTQNLVVRSHPTSDQGLVVDALLRNEAAYRQPFPGLYLRFSDIRGQTVAERTFKPATYLAGEMAGLKYIPAATEVRLSLEIVDPGAAAVSYSMVAVAIP